MDYPAPGDPDLADEVAEVLRQAFPAAHVPWAWPTGEHHRDYRVAADARPPHPPCCTWREWPPPTVILADDTACEYALRSRPDTS